jgi:translation elongation factor EF-Tu-like GTPase
MNETKIVSIFGGVIPEASEGDKTVVEMLKKLLEKAEAGQIIGLGYVCLHRDLCASWERGGTLGSFSSVGAAECLKIELAKIAVGD